MPRDFTKLQELMLYIASRCAGDPCFGATKLNKLLFYADFEAFRRLGCSITDAEYMKLEHGPVPRHLVPARDALLAAGDARLFKTRFHDKPQDRLVPLRDANLSGFTADQIALVEEIISRYWGATAAEISRRSHTLPAWRMTAENETIPYAATFFSGSFELTDEAIRYGMSLEDPRGTRHSA